jgi:hypothetical protein
VLHLRTEESGIFWFAAALRIRFRLTSNNTKQYDGVYVDDVTVQSP